MANEPSPVAPPALADAAERYGVAPADLVALGAFESDVYAFEGPHGPAVLKIVAPGHRDAAQVRAEVDWLRALAAAGVAVAEPLPSVRGHALERLGDHTLVAFRRVPGTAPGPGDWTPPRLRAWGELLGRLQAHARGWTPPGPRRRTLARQSYLRRAAAVLPDDPAFADAAARLAVRAAPLLNGGPGSGLIHADLHHGNLLLHQERLTAIDFDDCAYGAYAFDLAMPLYYAIRSSRDRDPDAVADEFLPPFLEGVRRHVPDPEGGADAVAAALDVRQAELVIALRAKLPPADWTDRTRALARDLRDRTIEGRPVLSARTLRRHLPG